MKSSWKIHLEMMLSASNCEHLGSQCLTEHADEEESPMLVRSISEVCEKSGFSKNPDFRIQDNPEYTVLSMEANCISFCLPVCKVDRQMLDSKHFVLILNARY